MRGEWQIAVHHKGGRWHMLGTSTGPNRRAALEFWIEKGGGVRAGTYGVRSPGQAAWRPFRVDASGVHANPIH